MNSLFQQLNPTRQLPTNVRNMIRQFKSMSNPQAMVQQMLQKNPQVNSILQASNGNYEKAFRDMARKMNVDADEFIRALQE